MPYMLIFPVTALSAHLYACSSARVAARDGHHMCSCHLACQSIKTKCSPSTLYIGGNGPSRSGRCPSAGLRRFRESDRLLITESKVADSAGVLGDGEIVRKSQRQRCSPWYHLAIC